MKSGYAQSSTYAKTSMTQRQRKVKPYCNINILNFPGLISC